MGGNPLVGQMLNAYYKGAIGALTSCNCEEEMREEQGESFFSLGRLRHAREGGGREGEEHHVHELQPQGMDNEVHQLEDQVGGELAIGHQNAEENHYVTNVEDGRARSTACGLLATACV